MSEIYNEEYYHNGCGPIPYEEPEHWVEFFGMIADQIVKDIHPQTVLTFRNMRYRRYGKMYVRSAAWGR